MSGPVGGGGGHYLPPRICLKNFLHIKYDILYKICRPHLNIWNHERADRCTIAHDIKWPLKDGQNSAQKNNTPFIFKCTRFLFYPKNKIKLTHHEKCKYVPNILIGQLITLLSKLVMPKVWGQYCPPPGSNRVRVRQIFDITGTRRPWLCARSSKKKAWKSRKETGRGLCQVRSCRSHKALS